VFPAGTRLYDPMREPAALARQRGVLLHTHLDEDDNDIACTRERFACRE
jgi:cytosine/adenosine deaminase-related metal-dependent hydrolase